MRGLLQGPYGTAIPNHPANPLHSGDWDQSRRYTFVNVHVGHSARWQPLRRPSRNCCFGPIAFLVAYLASSSSQNRKLQRFRHPQFMDAKCDAHGLPRKGLYLEGSFWQNSPEFGSGKKIEVQWSETEQGIRRLGLRITRAIYPRGKLIERIVKLLHGPFTGRAGRRGHKSNYQIVTRRSQKQIRLARSGARASERIRMAL